MNSVTDDQSGGDGRLAWFVGNLRIEHPLLLGMPFPRGVAPFLSKLQDCVAAAMDASNVRPQRVAAALELVNFVRRELAEVYEGSALVTQVLEIVGQAVHSAQIDYILAKLKLEACDIKVKENSVTCLDPCAVFLVRENEPLLNLRWIPQAVTSRWESVVRRLERMASADIKALGSDECLACIRFIFLYAQYGFHISMDREPSPAARHFHAVTGRSLWKALNEGVSTESRESMSAFDERFGLAAYNEVSHRLGVDLSESLNDQGSTDTLLPTSQVVEASAQPPQAQSGYWHTVAFEPFTPSTNTEEKETLARFSVLREPMALPQLPHAEVIEGIGAKLVLEFPWASGAIDAIFRDLRARRLFGSVKLGFQPILVLGPPGVGKTRLARRLAEELSLPFLSFSLAGMDDSRSVLGTSRGWSGAQASPILEFLVRHRSPVALIQLDELEKATNRSTNSAPPTTALLGLLEPENSRRWYDTYLQSHCDLSLLLFVATANTVDGIPGSLLSRMSTHVINRPTHEQMMQAIQPAIDDIAGEWSLPPEVLPTVYPSQLLGDAQNLRQLKALIRNVLSDWAERRLGPKRLH